jgi:hypothetical protein
MEEEQSHARQRIYHPDLNLSPGAQISPNLSIAGLAGKPQNHGPESN